VDTRTHTHHQGLEQARRLDSERLRGVRANAALAGIVFVQVSGMPAFSSATVAGVSFAIVSA
jgi:hypothetical protein